jgi:4'-phosphopantetheinyl transferase
MVHFGHAHTATAGVLSPLVRMTMSAVEIRIVYWLTEINPVDAPTVEQLSPVERARHDSFKFENNRRDFAGAHALLRSVLSSSYPQHQSEWTFVTSAHGKPELSQPLRDESHLVFNLTHTAGLVACAVAKDSELDLGIDAEMVTRRADPIRLAERYFSPAEIADLERTTGAERDVRFTELWTLKESFIKATGDGLSRPLDTFGFDLPGDHSIDFRSTGHDTAANWRFALFAPSPRHRMALAYCERPDGRSRSVLLQQAFDAGTCVAGSSSIVLRHSLPLTVVTR